MRYLNSLRTNCDRKIEQSNKQPNTNNQEVNKRNEKHSIYCRTYELYEMRNKYKQFECVAPPQNTEKVERKKSIHTRLYHSKIGHKTRPPNPLYDVNNTIENDKENNKVFYTLEMHVFIVDSNVFASYLTLQFGFFFFFILFQFLELGNSLISSYSALHHRNTSFHLFI